MARPILSTHKQYVSVEALHRIDGVVLPTAILWDDGRVYDIRRVISSARTNTCGNVEMRYKIVVSGKETYLYNADSRWWVFTKVYGETYKSGGDYDDSGDVAGTFGRV